MSSFVPADEEDFPQVHNLVDQILHEGVTENILNVASEFVPTNFEVLENWIERNRDGFTIRDLQITTQQIDTLIEAVERFSIKCKYLFDGFIAISSKVS